MAAASNSNMLFANFNQDFTCISVGTRKGYSITNCDPFGRVYTMNDGARGIVEMLFCTSLIALVGAADQPQSSPRKLQIVNTKRQSMICELLFPSAILAVKLNRKTLVIVLETEIYIYDISNMRLMHVIETTPNPDAIVALSPSADNSYLAYPSPVPSPTSVITAQSTQSPPSPTTSQTGDVLIFSTRSLTVANVPCSQPLRIKEQSSEYGVFLVRRSYTSSVEELGKPRYIPSISILCRLYWLSQTPSSPSGSIDSKDSNTQALEGGYEAFIDKKKNGGVSRRSLHLTKNITSSVGGYLPNTLTEMWEPSRDFAFLRLPTSGTRCVVAMSGTMPQVMVISSDGYFYCYSIDLENGGECTLLKQYSLLDSNDELTD
ncbi:Autophagy-related protein 18 [Abortiporus biennis]